MGRATVSTKIGAEGLDVNDGSDILIADTADKFADWVVEVMEQESLRQRLEEGAADKAAKYDWSVIAERFNGVLEKVRSSRFRCPSSGFRVLNSGFQVSGSEF